MKALAGLFSLLVIPFMLLNGLGGIVAGIWLAILGEWKTIFLGIALTLASKYIVSVLMIPSMAIAAPGVSAMDRGHKALGWLLLIAQVPWLYVIIIAWELIMFSTFGSRTTPENWFPVWLWSYGAATAVWAYMASQETKGDPDSNAGFMAVGAQIAYLILSVCTIHFHIAPIAAAPFMLIPLLLPLGVGILEVRARRRYA